MVTLPVVDGLSPEKVSEIFYQQGAVHFNNGLPASWINNAYKIIMSRFEEYLSIVKTKLGSDLGIGRDAGYAEIVQRSPGRYDMVWEWVTPFSDLDQIVDDLLMPNLRAMLGEECKIMLQGVVVSQPNAIEQFWHIDGEHLYLDHAHHLPAHCINIFIPLIDITPENGPTELCLGSHFLTKSGTRTFKAAADNLTAIGYTDMPVSLISKAGSIDLFDYRILHRGLANNSLNARPILYLVAARQWYRDRTFPLRRLFA